MYVDLIINDILYFMLYSAVTTVAIIACCYLLFGRANVFAPDVTPQPRLRYCTAAFIGVLALTHFWYLPILWLSSNDDVKLWYNCSSFLDYILFVPLVIAMLLTLLQDRRRPLWPAVVAAVPFAAGLLYYVITRDEALVPLFHVYEALLALGVIAYMVIAVKQYGRWLRDNYADLEHKEIWDSLIVAAVLLLFFVIYSNEVESRAFFYLIQVNSLLLICFLVWRVETLSDLGASLPVTNDEAPDDTPDETEAVEEQEDQNLPTPPAILNNIGELLHQHCIAPQLYLQHDLTLSQLAKAIGTNRYYLSQYFSANGTTYNAYINGLRINHFVDLYREAVAARRTFTAQQLANESGYRSYSTFSLAFKQRMGQNVTSWMRDSSI